MKKLQIVSCAVFFVVAAASAQANEYVAADDNPISQLCVSAAVDKPIRFFVNMRDTGVSKNYVANRVTCNGINITSFARDAGNDRNYQMLNKYRRGYVEINDLAQVTIPLQQITEVRGQLSEEARL